MQNHLRKFLRPHYPHWSSDASLQREVGWKLLARFLPIWIKCSFQFNNKLTPGLWVDLMFPDTLGSIYWTWELATSVSCKLAFFVSFQKGGQGFPSTARKHHHIFRQSPGPVVNSRMQLYPLGSTLSIFHWGTSYWYPRLTQTERHGEAVARENPATL